MTWVRFQCDSSALSLGCRYRYLLLISNVFGNVAGHISLSILRYLIHERSECLPDSIANLDQFPDGPEFEQFRVTYLEVQETQVDGTSLISDIKLFLKASDNSPFSPCRLESLKFLRKQVILFACDFSCRKG